MCLDSLNKGLFFVAQSLFSHVGVAQTYRHADILTRRYTVLAKPISGNQAHVHSWPLAGCGNSARLKPI